MVDTTTTTAGTRTKAMPNGEAPNNMDQKTVKTVRDALAVLNDAAEKGSAEIQDMIKRDYQDLGRLLGEIKPGLNSIFEDLKTQGYSQANEYKEQAVGYARERRSEFDRKIHEKPWTYLGYAALAGFVFGYIKGK